MIFRYILKGDGQAFARPLDDFWWRESLEFTISGSGVGFETPFVL
jgi:hypothetical protein